MTKAPGHQALNKIARGKVAAWLGVSEKHLSYVLYGVSPEKRYTEFTIPKRNGGMRLIKAPGKKLKFLQGALANRLYADLEKIEKSEKRKPVSFAFRKKLSIADNAKKHKGRRWVLNLDLQDFFPSFNFGRVRGFFIKDKNFKLNEAIATIIAQIACDGAALPQGSPCSPIISELIARILDMRLLRLAKKYKLTYTRYADDITFSASQKEFPASVAKQDSEDWVLGNELAELIERAGFKVNTDKTRMSHRAGRQMVTGLITNRKVNISDEYYRQTRAMCHPLFQKGFYYVKNYMKGPSKIEDLNPLAGRLSFIYGIKDKFDARPQTEKRDSKIISAIRRLYKEFLFYKYFIALDKPLIITEGKTDPVYLKEAVKRLPAFQPKLGEKAGDKFKHTVQYFNYRGSVDEVIGLYGGGTSNLKNIPFMYKYYFHLEKRKIVHKPMKFPVIIVLDNDSGLAKFASTVKEVTEKISAVSFDKDSKDDFYHIMDNLYVVKTLEGSKDTCIEDCFSKEIRAIKLDGKSFCPDNKTKKDNKKSGFDNKKHYGKEIFAQKVVKAKANKIDFSGFKPLLERIVKAIDNYEGRLKHNKP